MRTIAQQSVLFLTILLFTAVAGLGQNDNSNSNANTAKRPDRPLKILKKPFPSVDGKCSQRSGTTRVRVTFAATGKVTEVEMVITSGCDYFDSQSTKAAFKIKFLPAIEDGVEITVKKLIEYSYSRY